MKLLVVDDSAVARRVLLRAFQEAPGITAVLTAADGDIALRKVEVHHPDAVITDLVMPRMGGLELVEALRTRSPTMPVIVLSSHTTAGARATLKALRAGATAYVTKPSSLSTGASLDDAVREVLAVLERRSRRGSPAIPSASRNSAAGGLVSHVVRSTSRAAGGLQALVIGGSTGAPTIMLDTIGAALRGTRAPVLIAQHMPPTFTRIYAEQLEEVCGRPVREAEDGGAVVSGSIWLARGDHHMEVHRREDGGLQLRVHQGPRINFCRPSVDPVLASAAAAFEGRVLAMILTGMGSDGLDGCRAVREAGGVVFVQDEASSVVWSMPGSVDRAGIANAVLSPADLARSVSRLLGGVRQ